MMLLHTKYNGLIKAHVIRRLCFCKLHLIQSFSYTTITFTESLFTISASPHLSL